MNKQNMFIESEEEPEKIEFVKKKFIIGAILLLIIWSALLVAIVCGSFFISNNYCSCNDDNNNNESKGECTNCVYKKNEFRDIVNSFSPNNKGITKGKACWDTSDETSPQLYILLNGPIGQYKIPWEVSCKSKKCKLCFDTMAIPSMDSYSTYYTYSYTPTVETSYSETETSYTTNIDFLNQ